MAPIEFTKVERPAVTRQRKANPYADLAKRLVAGAKDEVTEATPPLPYSTEEDVKAVKSLINLVQAAGRELNASIRKFEKVTETETPEVKNGKPVLKDGKPVVNKTKTVVVSFWAVDAIKRPRSIDE